MGMKNTSAEVDRYIENAAPFAQPILKRIRAAFHKAQPDIEEVMKWRMPHFDFKGPVGMMAAFKQHVVWGFWKAKLMQDPHGILAAQAENASMGGGRVTKLSDLPSEKILIEYIREAVRLNEEGVKIARTPRRTGEPAVPPALRAALKKSAAATKHFQSFSPGQRREYAEWVAEAKTDATRDKRITQAIEWIAEGKLRNWKYMRK